MLVVAALFRCTSVCVLVGVWVLESETSYKTMKTMNKNSVLRVQKQAKNVIKELEVFLIRDTSFCDLVGVCALESETSNKTKQAKKVIKKLGAFST